MIGYLFVKEHKEFSFDNLHNYLKYQNINLFNRVFAELQLGAERKYGYGRVSLEPTLIELSNDEIFRP